MHSLEFSPFSLISFSSFSHVNCNLQNHHRPLCKDQAFRSQGKEDREEEENHREDGESESILQ